MKIVKCIFVILIIWFQIGVSQTERPFCKYMIKGIPQYLFKDGIRIDFDRRRGNSSSWITYSPSFYIDYGKGSWTSLSGYNRMFGVGLDLEWKTFVKNLPEPVGFYLGSGISWLYSKINLSQVVWVNTQENGLNVIIPEYKGYDETINKFGLNGIIGYQSTLWESFYLDVFCGMGIRYSFYQSPFCAVKFNDTSIDFGYTGFLLVGGVRFGVAW